MRASSQAGSRRRASELYAPPRSAVVAIDRSIAGFSNAQFCARASVLLHGLALPLLCDMSWKAYQGALETARRAAPAASLFAAASAGVIFVADHVLQYNVAHLVTKEELRMQSQELRSDLASLRAADLRAGMRAVPVLEGRTEALLAGQPRRSWWW